MRDSVLEDGRGSVGGTLVGAFVIGVLNDGLVLLGVSEKQSVDCLLVTPENADRFGVFELLRDPAGAAR